MTPFVRLTGTAAVLPEENVDTDIIFPARFLLITARDGLGRYAFHDRRFDAEGRERPDFVLNQPATRDATILIAGANFGSGSSREQAVWALLGFGIRCVIAPSFGEIFHANCFRNGVLPIRLADAAIDDLAACAAAGQRFTIDLQGCTLTVAGAAALPFALGPEQRLALLNGWDETALILNASGPAITAFEQRHRQSQPWLFAEDAASRPPDRADSVDSL